MENREGNVAVPFLVTFAGPKVRQIKYSYQKGKIIFKTVKFLNKRNGRYPVCNKKSLFLIK